MEQLFTREAVFGATGSAAPTSKFAYALINFLGAKIKVVQGYKGSNDLRIALNRGEIEGACGPSHSTLKTQWKDDIDSGRIRALVQFGLKKLPDLKDAAHIYDYAKSNEDREIFDVAFGPHVLGRPVIAPPGVPADRANALRAAFMRTMQDPELAGRDVEARARDQAVVRRGGRGAGRPLRVVPEERDRARDRGAAREAVAADQQRGHRGQRAKIA